MDDLVQKGHINKGTIYLVALLFSIICAGIAFVGGTSVGSGPTINVRADNSSPSNASTSAALLISPVTISGNYCGTDTVKTPSCQCQQASFEESFCKDSQSVCTNNKGTYGTTPPGSSDSTYCMYGPSSSVYKQKLSDSTCIIGCMQ